MKEFRRRFGYFPLPITISEITWKLSKILTKLFMIGPSFNCVTCIHVINKISIYQYLLYNIKIQDINCIMINKNYQNNKIIM